MKMKTKQVSLTRGLPKTGQTEVNRTGDDGDYQAGWWKGAPLKPRFVAKTIEGVTDDDVVIDRSTGLMWAADGNEAGCKDSGRTGWDIAIDYANALDFAGFTDWRVPNINELLSLVDYSEINPAIDASFFPNTSGTPYWSSTGSSTSDTDAWYVTFNRGKTLIVTKTSSYWMRCVRGGL